MPFIRITKFPDKSILLCSFDEAHDREVTYEPYPDLDSAFRDAKAWMEEK